jgi:hypothetical protein
MQLIAPVTERSCRLRARLEEKRRALKYFLTETRGERILDGDYPRHVPR